jgi:hypothetical protein
MQEPEEHEQRPCDGRLGSKFHSRKMRSSLHGHSLFLGPKQLRTHRQDTFAQPAVAVGRVIALAWIELLQKAGHPHRTQALTCASMPARRNAAGVAVLPSMGSATFMVIYTRLAYINAASVPDVSPNVSAFLASAALFEAYARRLPVEWLHASVARL